MVLPVLAGAAATGTPGAERAQEWQWAHSRDGQTLLSHGCDVTALLPRDDQVVLVLPVLTTSWHRVALPKVNTARLRQALDGLLEDRLLADPAQLHLALEHGLSPGHTGWVCASARAPLRQWLAMLQDGGRPASRIVPELCPQPQGQQQALVCADQPWLVVAGPQGVLTSPLAPRTDGSPPMASPPSPVNGQRLAEPACAAAAETALNAPVALQTTAQRLLAATQTGWNLAQFDLRLSAGARRGQRLGQSLQAMAFAPAWRTTRWGLGALLVSGLLGLNGLAWQERQQLLTQRQHIQQLLTQTFPRVTLVLDAPLQMQREVDRLRRSAGEPGPHDLEPLLESFSALAQDSIELSAIEYTSTSVRLTLANPGQVPAPALQALREGLQRQGWRSQYTAPVLNVQAHTPGAQP